MAEIAGGVATILFLPLFLKRTKRYIRQKGGTMFVFIVSILIFLWVVYDLIVGSVWSYRKIYRKYEPGMYWTILAMWFFISVFYLIPYYLWW